MRKTFQIDYEWDIVPIRSDVREMAKEVGFDDLDQARIVQSISELARNVIQHAERGTLTIFKVKEDERVGLRIQVKDLGPGIPDFDQLMRHQSRQIGEASGLQQVGLLMDELISIPVELGTCVEATKWVKPSRVVE
ncbi:ATP-binding protein [Hazenella coriacea]|uniref:Serine/threonine-protein kinase RsbT n=1 Tax=Hazenella coriacea TaxID=1179467 RepID=A0A4R3L0U2_9BACL|nr:ATP-binding protein [Hazenella coriacea]TCS92812.1 serine/threonine-protein kinase RsbT [Hazenella coriacea]